MLPTTGVSGVTLNEVYGLAAYAGTIIQLILRILVVSQDYRCCYAALQRVGLSYRGYDRHGYTWSETKRCLT